MSQHRAAEKWRLLSRSRLKTHSAASLPKEAAIASRNEPLEAPANEEPKIPLLLPVSEPEAPLCRVIVLSGELLDIAIGPGIVIMI